METIEVNISLDPVNDGVVCRRTDVRRKEKGALIIATSGEYRIADEDEAQELLDKLSEKGVGEYIGNTDYLAVLNKDKIISVGYEKYFVGTAVIVKYDGKSSPSMLSDDEFDEAAKQFVSRLITLVGDGQEFSAYEI